MKAMIRLMAVAVGLMFAQMAVAQAAPAGSTGVCRDGTYTSAPSKKGACRGHKGVKTWLAAEAAPAAAKTATKTTTATKTAAASAPSAAPAGSTGVCRDGTYTSAPSKKGACRGHKGVQTWLAAETAPAAKPVKTAAATPAAAPAPAPAPAPAKPARTHESASRTAPAPGGGPGMVWVNTASNVYHCPGTKYYGTTKAGEYMTEAQAQAKGARADHNHPCGK